MKDFEKEKDRVIPVIQKVFGSNLVSLILYGSYVKGNFIPGRSDINLMIVRKKNKAEELSGLTGYFKIWRRRFNLALPLVLTEEEIRRSTDVYPMEYSDIRENHRVLYGKDIYRSLKIPDSSLRLELENQVKSKLIFIRTSFVQHSQRPWILKHILLSTFSTIHVLLLNILKLSRKVLGKDIQDVIRAAEGLMRTKLPALERLRELKRHPARLNRALIKKLYLTFIQELEEMADYVDRFKSKKR